MIFGSAIQNAICLYILLVVLLFVLKPQLLELKDENGNSKSTKCVLPVALIIIAIVCYYFFATIEWYRGR